MPSVGTTPTTSPSPIQPSLLQLDNSDLRSLSASTTSNDTSAPSHISKSNVNPSAKPSNVNNLGISRLSQFMIITPAVTIDRNCNSETPIVDAYYTNEPRAHHFEYVDYESLNSLNNNLNNDIRNANSFRRPLPCRALYNRSNLLSWRWCTLLCAAMRCFGAGGSQNSQSANGNYEHPCSNSHAAHGNSATRNAQYTLPRRSRDRLNKFTYEL